MQFDLTDEECWNFGSINRDATDEVLMNKRHDVGVFLIRICSKQPEDFVLSVRDQMKVRHYRIHPRKRSDQTTIYIIGDHEFSNIKALLAYFHENSIDSNSSLKLKRPACIRGPIERPNSIDSTDSSGSTLGNGMILPAFASVTADRIPNAYDKNALTLHEGDLVKVTKINVSGIAEGVCKLKFGTFPFHLLEFFDH